MCDDMLCEACVRNALAACNSRERRPHRHLNETRHIVTHGGKGWLLPIKSAGCGGDRGAPLASAPAQIGRHSRLCSAQCATWHSRLQHRGRQRGCRAGQGRGTLQQNKQYLVYPASVPLQSPCPLTPHPARICSTRRGGSGCTCGGPAHSCRSRRSSRSWLIAGRCWRASRRGQT